MIERLDQLSLEDFIELSCGNPKVLHRPNEEPTEEELLRITARLMNEYKAIATPTEAKMDLADGEDITKLRMRERCTRICLMLCSQERCDMAREVLLELDVSPALIATDEQVKARCRAMNDEAAYEIKRYMELKAERAESRGKQTEDGIRRGWYGEIAFVMASLKMAIDPKTVNAAIYANLVRQAVERNKAMAKMPPMMGMFM